jgi:hypothetical protein
MADVIRWKAALIASLLHFVASILVAAFAAYLVFGIWFPFPYREMSGGRELFVIVMMVDVICGPLLTAVVYNPKKPTRELFVDLGIIGFLQLAALAYGIYSVALARPVYLAFEVDRFRVVAAADVDPASLKPDINPLHSLSWIGPKIVGVRDPKNPSEMLESLDLSLQGLEPSARPDWWQPYDLSKPQILARSKSIGELKRKQPNAVKIIDQAISESKAPESALVWLPLTSFKASDWVVLLDRESAEVRGFVHVDGF